MTVGEALEKLEAYCDRVAEEDISFGNAVANYERG